jgi:hypothetical protein
MSGDRFTSQTYYDILEVEHNAAPQEIHAAYQRARATYSTESPALYTMFTQQEAKELLLLIEEAFDTLSNHQRRQIYDQRLAGRTVAAPAPSSGSHQKSPLSVATAAKELPDFPLEDSMLKPPKKKDATPEGHGKTKFGSYPLDPRIEDEICQAQLLDGQFLKRVRIYKKISVDQMCDETRINKPYFLAVEADDPKSLPAPVFVRGFIIQIARILGLDEKKASESYMRNFKSKQ